MAKPKIFFTDYDGMLKDNVGPAVEAANCVRVAYEMPPLSLEGFQAAHEIPIRKFYRNAGFPQEIVDNELKAMQAIFWREFAGRDAEAPLRDGVADALSDMRDKGTRIVIVSNNYTDRIDADLERYGIADLIHAVISFDRGEKRDRSKGQKMQAYMRQRRVDARHCVIAGDTVEETNIGKACAMCSISLTGGYDAKDRLLAERNTKVFPGMPQTRPLLRQFGML